jgi:hypothetical protein
MARMWHAAEHPATVASSSRSQVAARLTSAAAFVTCDRPSVGVRWRPRLAVAIVTHFATQSSVRARRMLAWHVSARVAVTGAVGDTVKRLRG